MFHLCMSLSLLRLTWLANPALVTLVYPNQMQYMPRVLQEASLLDGVDAGVRGNGRRFSKTSSFLPATVMPLPPLSLSSHDVIVPFVLLDSFVPTTHFIPVLPYKSFSHSLSPLFPCHFLHLTRFRNIFYLWQNNVVRDLPRPLSYLV